MSDRHEDPTEVALRTFTDAAVAVLAQSLAEAYREIVGSQKVAAEMGLAAQTLIRTNGPFSQEAATGPDDREVLPGSEEEQAGIIATRVREALFDPDQSARPARSNSEASSQPSASYSEREPSPDVILSADLIASRGRPTEVDHQPDPAVRDFDPLLITEDLVRIGPWNQTTPIATESVDRPELQEPSQLPLPSTLIVPTASSADFGLVSTLPRATFEASGPSATIDAPGLAEPDLKGFIPISAQPTRNWAGTDEGPSLVPAFHDGMSFDPPRRPVFGGTAGEPGSELEGSIERILSLLGEVLKGQRSHLPTSRRPSRPG